MQTKLIDISQYPEYITRAAAWFSSKWNIPVKAYQESMQEAQRPGSDIPRWYIVLDGKGDIIAGAGVIQNDFHDRKDLSPNLCALFVEEAYRRQGIAGRILAHARREMGKAGYIALYLVTDHTAFYERYGWTFHTMVTGDDGLPGRLYAAPTLL